MAASRLCDSAGRGRSASLAWARGSEAATAAGVLKLGCVVGLVALDPLLRQRLPGRPDPQALAGTEPFGRHHVGEEYGVLFGVQAAHHTSLDVAERVQQDRRAGDAGLDGERRELVAVPAGPTAEPHDDGQ